MSQPISDHLGRDLALDAPPRRIVSLVPSITETLVALGAGGRLVGRTDYCIHPADAVAGVPTIGGTKTPDLTGVLALEPDLVLANKEENRERDVDQLAARVPVFVTDVRTVAGARVWVDELAQLLEGRGPARPHAPSEVPAPRPARPRTCALVWRRPFIAVGEDTYAADVMAAAGLANVFEPAAGRYPRLASLEDLASRQPELVVLPSEPYLWAPEEGRELEQGLAALGVAARSVHVGGESMTWWGTRSERAARELREAIR